MRWANHIDITTYAARDFIHDYDELERVIEDNLDQDRYFDPEHDIPHHFRSVKSIVNDLKNARVEYIKWRKAKEKVEEIYRSIINNPSKDREADDRTIDALRFWWEARLGGESPDFKEISEKDADKLLSSLHKVPHRMHTLGGVLHIIQDLAMSYGYGLKRVMLKSTYKRKHEKCEEELERYTVEGIGVDKRYVFEKLRYYEESYPYPPRFIEKGYKIYDWIPYDFLEYVLESEYNDLYNNRR
ncbi:MAG TPA: hypothetical protein ENF47_05475 [Thermoprotei archaeon]|nr:hypothetical protein [Thermoprotei archaeon]